MSQKRKQEDSEHESEEVKRIVQVTKDHMLRSKCFKAVENGNLEELQKLIREDLRKICNLLEDTDWKGNTYLMRVMLECKDTASYKQREAMVKFLLAEAPQLATHKNKEDEIPIRVACRSVLHWELISLLLQHNPGTINEEGHLGRSLLHLVAYAAGDTQKFEKETPVPGVERAKFFRDDESDSEGTSENVPNESPLPHNTIFNAVPIAELLLKHGANIHAEDDETHTILQALLSKKVNYIHCPHFEKFKDLYEENVLKFVEVLLQNGARLCSSSSASAFSDVCSVEVAKLMIKYRPEELNAKDRLGRTPLHQLMLRFSNQGEKTKIILFLIDNGAVVEEGTDPIMLIRNNSCQFEVLEHFLDKTPDYDVNSIDENGWNVLCKYGESYKIVKKLLSLGADFSLTSKSYHIDALEKANKNNDPQLVKYLLQNGVSPYLITEGCTFIILVVREATSFLNCIVHHFVTKTTENVEEWREVLKYYLALPQMTDKTMPEELKALYTHFLPSLFNLENINCENMLEALDQLLLSNKSICKITCTDVYKLRVNKYMSRDCEVEFCSIVFYFACRLFCGVEYKELHTLLQKMLNHGMSISNPPNCISILAVALSLLCVFNIKDVETKELRHSFVELFIANGVNVESSALKLEDVYDETKLDVHDVLQSRYQLPDALAIACLQKDPHHVEIFLRYWWAPPLLLLQLTETTADFWFWLPILIKYGGIPHGTPMYKDFTEEISSMYRDEVPKKSKDAWSTWKLMSKTAVSLQELCKYKIRELVSKKASQPGHNLPQILHDLLPPLLRPVVIH